jgi:hypothetical protein
VAAEHEKRVKRGRLKNKGKKKSLLILGSQIKEEDQFSLFLTL